MGSPLPMRDIFAAQSGTSSTAIENPAATVNWAVFWIPFSGFTARWELAGLS